MSLEILFDPALAAALGSGVLIGIVVGAVPGLTATLAISLLLPVTFHLPATQAVVMMTGIFTGGIYGGSIAAITVGIPGAPASAMTVLDGYAMARGRGAGIAIGLATFSSFVGGMVGGIVLLLCAPQIAALALRFGSPEMFALIVLALVAVATVNPDQLAKGTAATVIGLMLSTVGIDGLVPVPRFTFGAAALLVGVPLIPVVIGLFAVAELLHQVGEPDAGRRAVAGIARGGRGDSWRRAAREVGWWTFLESSLIGTAVGALPGAGAAMAAFLAYTAAKRRSAHPERFGQGDPAGIVAPEAANNAMTGGAFIPMLALGIPGDAVTAVILGGLIVHGITPGPQLFTDAGGLVRSLMAAYFLSYVVILAVGLGLLPVFARIATVPRAGIFPAVAALAIVAAFASERTVFAMELTAILGVVGFVLRRFGYPVIPVLLGLILGPMLEANLRRSLILSDGDPWVFLSSPVSLALLMLAAVLPWLIRRTTRGPVEG